ncbi:MAG: type I-C CRISPR-associated endonuclease Cas1c [bacterium]
MLNTLYVTTAGAYVHRDGSTLKIEVEKQERLRVPIHHLESVVAFDQVLVSPGALHLMAENGVALSYLGYSGRLVARVDAPGSGNVLLRRKQFRRADDPAGSLAMARNCVAGKVQNSRNNLMRGSRDAASPETQEALARAGNLLANHLGHIERAADMDELRGHEGIAAKDYFEAIPDLIRQQKEQFKFDGRNRRPPKDPVNALLSFIYALLLHDCVAGLASAGLDPNVGFLHADRPGKPSLALDLMEEFRPALADRLALSLINRRQVQPSGFAVREGGGVEMDDATRKAVIGSWQERKKERLTHPLLEQECSVGQLPFIQARLMARTIRGDDEAYIPYLAG